jgi:PhzF family phenazine biosynthesis protein
MKNFPFKKIDAFTKGLSAGNPCACIYLKSRGEINDREMQQIAAELKGFVNEVVYVFPEDKCFYLKYYSAECAVDFCGHGTIGVMYDLIKSNHTLLGQDIIKIRVRNEYLSVYNKIAASDSVFITAPSPAFNLLHLTQDIIAGALRIGLEDINNRFEPALINAGLNTLLVPISNLRTTLDLFPDQLALKDFCLENGIDIILVFTDEVADPGNKYRTRVFAPKFGYLEDPATGSGNSAFGNYLLQNELWDGTLLSIEQNSSFDFPNIIKLDTVSRNDRKNVIFGGSAVVKIEGTYTLSQP